MATSHDEHGHAEAAGGHAGHTHGVSVDADKRLIARHADLSQRSSKSLCGPDRTGHDRGTMADTPTIEVMTRAVVMTIEVAR
jgi:hypothetical protein